MAPEPEPSERFHISTSQVIASSLAAVSAAVVCSYFGVAGTVIGTAITSLVATTGSALYAFSLRRTKTRLRQLHRAGAASPPLAEVIKTMREQGRFLLNRRQWATLAIGVGAVFVFSLGIVTVIEGTTNLNGAPLHHHHKRHHTVTPTETPSPSATSPSPSATPSATSSGSPRPQATKSTPGAVATVTVTATPSPSATLTPEPTATPTVTPGSASPSVASS